MVYRSWIAGVVLFGILVWGAAAQTPGQDASPYGPQQKVMMLVDTTLSASNFASQYQPTGAVLVSEVSFPEVSRSLWTFHANIPQFSLLRASFVGTRGASVLATSSRSEDEIVAAYSTNLWNLDRIDQLTDNYNGQYNPGPGYTGAGTHLYVMDTGVVPNSPELAGRVTLDYSAVEPQFADDNNHGSHVAGIAASTTYGVAKLANVHSYKVLSSTGSGTLEWLAQGLVHLRGNFQRPAVINLSLTYSGYDAVIDALLTELIALGVGVVAAGGNSGVDACSTYPCITSGVICVGSTTKVDQRSSFSNYGTCIDIWAPGSLIISIDKNGNVLTLSGTSMSAPHVAAACLLYLQANPFATPARLAAAIIAVASADQLLATTLGARSPNRMLYVVWGTVPTTLTLGGAAVATTGVVTSSGTTSTASVSASTSAASTTNRVTTTMSASTASVSATTSALRTSTASTTLARTTVNAATAAATGNAKSTSTVAVTTTRSATSSLSTSNRATTTALTSTRSATTRSASTSRSLSTSVASTTNRVATTASRSTTAAAATTKTSRTTRSTPSSAESGGTIFPSTHLLLWVIFSIWMLNLIDIPAQL